MEAQYLSWWCGVASIQSALECLGIEVSQEYVATQCHVTKKHGTNEDEIQRGLLACGAGHIDKWNSRRRKKSMVWLQDQLTNTGPAILCVDNDRHWVTAIGILSQTTFLVFDPAGGVGLQVYEWNELADRWRLAPHKSGPSYYAIGCSL